MKRVAFRLSMPGRASWNGGWSGEGRNFVIYHDLTDKSAAKLFPEGKTRTSFSYHFGDGWSASVDAQIMVPGQRKAKSDGFAGYDWMVRSILQRGEIRASNAL